MHLFNMAQSPQHWSRSRAIAMEDPVREPSTVRKASGESRSRSVGSSRSYPRIPRRGSSLSASFSSDPNGPTTSTRTPSLCDSLYQIQVVKRRRSGGKALRDTGNQDIDSTEGSASITKSPKQLGKIQESNTKAKNQPRSRLMVRWSSGSWDSLGRDLTSGSNSVFGSRETRPSTPDLRQALKHKNQKGVGSLGPLDLPISFVSVRSIPNKPQIGLLSSTLCATVQVSADVNSVSVSESSDLAPLDVIILLHSVAQPSVNILTQITFGASALASNLLFGYDRIGLAYVDGRKSLGFEVLLSLDFHSMDAVRSALNLFLLLQPPNYCKASLSLGEIIERVSGLFSGCPRSAFCHLFFVSGTSPLQLAIPSLNQAIGFNTITPQPCLPLNQSPLKSGWHIYYDVGVGNACPRGAYFIRKVSRVVRQLRTGICPGSVLNLRLSIIPAKGCQILSVMNDCQVTLLRPGETWIVPVKMSVPSAFHSITPGDRSQSPAQHPLIEEMVSQINDLLMEYSSGEVIQPILTARVEYQHSLLPATSTIHEESQLTVLRSQDSAMNSSLDY
ncbi:hypothetical protein N7523_005309 [Penicillium sp. IBT 18751x]|nr:hypothetical protein N7523_005309 [Penicillium sp. IBT 18751x]